jgi:hypothetical protein
MRAGSTAALFDPGFYFRSIPDDAPRCEIEPAWKLAALLHLVNRSVCKRYHLPELTATNRAFEDFSRFGGCDIRRDRR